MSPDWNRLAEPFPDDEVKQRPGAATWDHKSNCEGNRCRDTKDPNKHIQFSYVDARAVAQRLDDVLTPDGWDFTCATIPGSDVVKGTLRIGDRVREDHGYPNSDRDEEPIKAATSDALKRCAVLYGIGRHLYGDNKGGQRPAQPRPAPTPIRAPQTPPRSSTAVPEMPEFPVDWDAQPLPQPVGKPFPFQPIGRPQPNLGDACPDHPGETWRGEPGSLYHRKDEGGYCRPEGQPKQARR